MRRVITGDPSCLGDRGCATLSGLYSDDACAHFRAALQTVYTQAGSPALYSKTPIAPSANLEVSGTGFVARELLGFAPELASQVSPFFPPRALELLRAVLGADMRLELVAGVIADHTRPFLGWHHHAGGVDDELYRRRGLALDAFEPASPTERVSMIVYLDPMREGTGELLVRPGFDRTEGGPIDSDWPNQHVFALEPGDAVLLDQRVWHAVRPRREGLPPRMFVGFWFARADARPAEVVDSSLRAAAFTDEALRGVLTRSGLAPA